MSGTESVRVTVTSVTGDDTLIFSGSGALSRDSRGTHLRYTARDDAGNEVTSALHLGMGRAMVDNGAYRLLLDPSRPTSARIAAEGGTLELTVTTHHIHADLIGCEGTISLHYTLSTMGHELQEMQVTLALRPMEQER